MILNKLKTFLLFFVVILTINTATAGFNIDVTSSDNSVSPGGTARYAVAINPIESLDITEYVNIMVNDSSGNPISWDNRFSKNMFPIGPYVDGITDGDTVNLEIDVPAGTPAGVYYMKITGNGYYDNFIDPDFIAESDEIPIYVDVQIPEFPTIAMPIISVLGLVFLMSRRKEVN